MSAVLKSIDLSAGQSMSDDALMDIVKNLLDQYGHHRAPLVRKIADGKASREQIARLGIYFANFTRVSTNVLGMVYARCYDESVRRKIFDNLIDEDTGMRCGDKPHHELALDFATRFTGMSEEQVRNHPIPYELHDINNYRLRVASEAPVPIAMGMFGLAGEASFATAVAAISDGLREHYGVRDEDQQSWIVHIEGDEEHSEMAEDIVRKRVRGLADQHLCIRLCAEYLDRFGYLWGLSEDPAYRPTRSALQEVNKSLARS